MERLSRGGRDKMIGFRRGKDRTNHPKVGSHSSTTCIYKLTICSPRQEGEEYELCNTCNKWIGMYALSCMLKQSIRVYVYLQTLASNFLERLEDSPFRSLYCSIQVLISLSSKAFAQLPSTLNNGLTLSTSSPDNQGRCK